MKWTDEASGAYIQYVSIAEEGTSPRAHSKNLTHHQNFVLDGSPEPWYFVRARNILQVVLDEASTYNFKIFFKNFKKKQKKT